MNARMLAIAAVVVAAVVAAGVVLRGRGSSRHRVSTTLELRERTARAYRWSLTTTVTTGNGMSHETSYSGLLSLRILSRAGGDVLGAQFSQLEVRQNGVVDPKMGEALSYPFLVGIDARGRLGEGRFGPELAPADRALLDNAIRPLEVVLPEQPTERWEATESDSSGDYVAEYRRESSGAIVKSKLRYVSLRQGGGWSMRVLSSQIRAELATGAWLERSSGSEEIEIQASDGRVFARVRARFSLEPAGERPDRDLALFHDEALGSVTLALGAPSPGESAWDASDRERLRAELVRQGVTLESLLAGLSTHRLQDAAYAHRFALYLKLFPDRARGLAGRLRGLGDSESALLVNILQLAGTPEAQAELLEVAESTSQSRDNRIRTLVAMASVEQPTADSAQRLSRDYAASRAAVASSDVAATTLLTLGAVAGRVDDSVGKPLRTRLAADLSASTTPAEQALYLRSLDNAGAPLPADSLAPYLRSQSAAVRSAAVDMLAAAGEADTAAELVVMLATEPSAGVRGAIVSGLLQLPPSDQANDAIARALSEGLESDARVRGQMVAYLVKTMPAHPSNRTVLQSILAREKDRQVMLAILNALVP